MRSSSFSNGVVASIEDGGKEMTVWSIRRRRCIGFALWLRCYERVSGAEVLVRDDVVVLLRVPRRMNRRVAAKPHKLGVCRDE